MSDELNKLRQTIDGLDDEILDLVGKRMRLAAGIIAAKRESGAYRPGREAAVVRRLLASARKTAPDVSPQLLIGVWRQLMTASMASQNRDIHVAAHGGAMRTAGWHFGGVVGISACGDVGEVRKTFASGADFAFVPRDCDGELAEWLIEDTGIFIIAMTPLVQMPQLPATWIVGREPADPAPVESSVLAWRDARGEFAIECAPGRMDAPPADRAGTGRLAGVIASIVDGAGAES